MRLKILFIIAILFSIQSYAGQWPVITGITLLTPGGPASRYTTQAQMIEVGAVADQIVDDYYNVWHYASIVKRQGRTPGNPGTLLGADGCGIKIIKQMRGKPVSYYLEKAYKECNGKTLTGQPDQNTACIGYVLYKGSHIDWNEVLSPVGTCFQLDDVNQWCSLTTPELNINHGVLSVKDAAGNRAKQTLNINCTTPAKVTLTLIGNQDTIPIGGGTSHLTSSLGALGKEISLQAGNNSVDIISELNNVKEGEWNASAVMMMELN